MNEPLDTISIERLAISFIPVFIVLYILFRWSLNSKTALYAVSRMLAQLTLAGYFLKYLFEAQNWYIVLASLCVMVSVSSWISLRTIAKNRTRLYIHTFGAILIGGGSTLMLVTQAVLNLEPWFYPRYMIILGGMIFSSSMNCVSLAADRFFKELQKGSNYNNARNEALKTALIPITNTLFAVGLITFPGMMAGQIISGVDPFIAIRYQIMVMCMVYASAGLSSALFLVFVKKSREEITN
ncbi:MAG: ABC transporter permease [Leptospirales bacterium]